MTTEPEVVETSKTTNKVLDSTAIEAKIEFALGKDDITDMLLEEHIEVLENQLKIADQEKEQCRLRFIDLEKEHDEYLISLFKKEFAKEIKFAKKYMGEIQAGVNTQNKFNLTPPKNVELISNTTQDYNGVQRRTKRPHKVHQSFNGFAASRGVVAYAKVYKDPDNTLNRGTNRNDKYTCEHATWDLKRNYSDDELKEMPTIKKLIENNEAYQLAQEKAAVLENDMNNIETSTKRAKAKLVRSLLSASEQGRQLLEKMPRMGDKLLLVDGNG